MLATDGAGGHSAIQGPFGYRRSNLQVSEMRTLRKLDRQSERPQSQRRPEYSPLGCGADRLSWRPRYCLIAQLKRINLRLAASIRYTLRVARRSGNLKQCVTRMRDHKSAQEHLKKAEQCFDLGDEGHDLAEKIHESAAKQLDMAAKQKSMGAEQHLQADKIEAQAAKSNDLGRRLQANAVEIEGDTQFMSRGRRPA
jgi:hypothetical protein